MSPLRSELSRLYFATESSSQSGGNGESADGDAAGLMAVDGRVRAMVLELARPADWSTLGAVWRGVQADMALPEPAIAVSGTDGHQLWFSLAEPVCVADALRFLEALRVRYLGTVEPRRIRMVPGFDARVVPALQAENGRWSAFVSSDLAGIFTDEPWLDLAPNPDAQARLLSRLECTKPGAFQAILDRIKPASGTAISQVAPSAREPSAPEDYAAVDQSDDSAAPSALATGAKSREPKRFLMDVMNDPTVALDLRIEAAKALLPYF